MAQRGKDRSGIPPRGRILVVVDETEVRESLSEHIVIRAEERRP